MATWLRLYIIPEKPKRELACVLTWYDDLPSRLTYRYIFLIDGLFYFGLFSLNV